MTAVLGFLQLLLLYLWIVPGSLSVIGINYSTAISTTSPPPSPAPPLPEGYVRFSEDRAAYKIHPERMSWYEARDTCISEGARLATTDSQEKIIHIQSLSAHSALPFAWVGIHKPENGDEWVRVDDGLPVSSIPWSPSFLDNTGENCAVIFTRNRLMNFECFSHSYFVCEIPDSGDDNSKQSTTEADGATPPPSSPVPPTLPVGYRRFPEDRAAYKIHLEWMSWYEARDTCISEGAHLAIIDSKKKVNHIMNLTPKDNHYSYVHVGIHKPATSDEWVRIDNGLPVSSSVPWATGYPNGVARDRCAQLFISRGTLYHLPCWFIEWFVCEISISDDNDGVKHEE